MGYNTHGYGGPHAPEEYPAPTSPAKRPALPAPDPVVIVAADNLSLVMDAKPTNPKDAIGSLKPSVYAVVPPRVMWGVALAFLDGTKYGAFNYRKDGVQASVYTSAAKRHIDWFTEGQNKTTDSKLHHIDHAIAGLMILRDSIIEGNWTDDRPMGDRAKTQAHYEDCLAAWERLAKRGVEKYPFTRLDGVLGGAAGTPQKKGG